MKSHMTANALKIQNPDKASLVRILRALIPGVLESEPTRNAIKSVTDVNVIEGPAIHQIIEYSFN